MKQPTVTARAVGLFSWILLACNGTNAFTTPASQRIYLPQINHVTWRSLHVSNRTNAMSHISQADIATLLSKGYVAIPNFIPRDLVEELCEDIRDLRSNSAFREAKIGQDSTNELNTNIRIAETCFLGRNRPELTQISGSDSIRDRSNGLYDILDGLCDSLAELCWKDSASRLDKSLTELLYAYYPSGGFYRRHRDAIPNSASILRKYSLLLYLNRDGWSSEEDAGQLRIHLDGGGDEVPPGAEPNFIDVDPLGGTLVLFKSELIPHEVLNTNSERFALVGITQYKFGTICFGRMVQSGSHAVGYRKSWGRREQRCCPHWTIGCGTCAGNSWCFDHHWLVIKSMPLRRVRYVQ